MRNLLYIKALKRKEKSQSDFNCFVVKSWNTDRFFSKLKKNIHSFPNNTRFQLCVEFGFHWFVVDCYINQGILHTATLDAVFSKAANIPTLSALEKHFPEGKHYYFINPSQRVQLHFPGDHLYLQHAVNQCHLFTLEHAALLSKTSPEKFYAALENGNKWNYKNTYLFEKANLLKINGYYAYDLFSGKKIPNEELVLAPLFRSMQSLTNYKNSPENFKSAVVSQKGCTLDDWMTKNLNDGMNKTIHNKNVRLKKSLNENTHYQKAAKPSAFGFVLLPEVITISQQLEQLPLNDIEKTIADFTQKLTTQAPRQTKKTFLFFHFAAMHTEQMNLIISLLNDLTQSNNKFLPKQKVKIFADILYNLAGYLDYYHSDRTWNVLQRLVKELNTNLLPQNQLNIPMVL